MIVSDAPARLKAEGLRFAYRGTACNVLEDVDFCAHPGERIALVGPSGCGKTTLLRVLEGSLDAAAGTVNRCGKVVLVYQDHRLVAEASVLENVCMGAGGGALRFRPEVVARAHGLLAEVGLAGLEDRRVSEVSGGQRQRVALARALCAEPDVLLADEPFANLDRETALSLAALLREMQARHGFVLVCSAHDADRIPEFFTRTYRLECCGAGRAARAADASPRRFRPLGWILAALLVVGLAAVPFARHLPPLDDSLREGWRLLAGLLPWPLEKVTAAPWGHLLGSLAVTVQMALVGTAIGAVVSLPLAMLASLPGRPGVLTLAARAVSSVIRAVPSIVWALLFVAVLGIGPVAGIVALAAYSTGYLTRMFTDEVENVDDKPARALMQMGMGRLAVWRRALLPPAAPGLLGAGFFVFEYNVRGAAVLGLVGAGGIGTDLAYYVEWRQFPALAAALTLIVVVAIGLDTVSRRLRGRLSRARGI